MSSQALQFISRSNVAALKGTELTKELERVQQELQKTNVVIEEFRRRGEIFTETYRKLEGTHKELAEYRERIEEALKHQFNVGTPAFLQSAEREMAELLALLVNPRALDDAIASQRQQLDAQTEINDKTLEELQRMFEECSKITQQRKRLAQVLQAQEASTASLDATVRTVRTLPLTTADT